MQETVLIHFLNLRSLVREIVCDGIEKQEYKSHYAYVVNRLDVRYLQEIGEHRVSRQKHFVRQHTLLIRLSTRD